MGDHRHQIRIERTSDAYGRNERRRWACTCGWTTRWHQYPQAATAAAAVRHVTYPDKEPAHAAP